MMDVVGAAKLGATQGSDESYRPLLFPLRREGGKEGRKEGWRKIGKREGREGGEKKG